MFGLVVNVMPAKVIEYIFKNHLRISLSSSFDTILNGIYPEILFL